MWGDFFHVGVVALGATGLIAAPELLQELRRLAADPARDTTWRRWLAGHLVAAGAVYAWTTVGLSYGLAASSAGGLWFATWAALLLVALALWCFALAGPPFWTASVRRCRLAILGGLLAACGWVYFGGHVVGTLYAWERHVTIDAVARILRVLGYSIVVDPVKAVLGTPRFEVAMSAGCLGYEGMALVLGFGLVYLIAYHRWLRFPRAFLLLPAAALVSYALNLARLVALVIVGDWRGDVAVEGFHSVAGWLSFAAVALGTVLVSHRASFMSKGLARTSSTPASSATFYLLPMLVIVAIAMLSAAVARGVDVLYPLRVISAGAVLLFYRSRIKDLGWRGSGWAIVPGVLTFVIWIALEPRTPVASAIPGTLAGLPAWIATTWLVARIAGSSVTVPIAEELAFRGYLLRKLTAVEFDAVALQRWSWAAFAGSSVLFGALHGRWIAGTVAGMIFALTLRRRGHLADPIVAHATANVLIAGYVLIAGAWTLWE